MVGSLPRTITCLVAGGGGGYPGQAIRFVIGSTMTSRGLHTCRYGGREGDNDHVESYIGAEYLMYKRVIILRCKSQYRLHLS